MVYFCSFASIALQFKQIQASDQHCHCHQFYLSSFWTFWAIKGDVKQNEMQTLEITYKQSLWKQESEKLNASLAKEAMWITIKHTKKYHLIGN